MGITLISGGRHAKGGANQFFLKGKQYMSSEIFRAAEQVHEAFQNRAKEILLADINANFCGLLSDINQRPDEAVNFFSREFLDAVKNWKQAFDVVLLVDNNLLTVEDQKQVTSQDDEDRHEPFIPQHFGLYSSAQNPNNETR